MKKLSSIHAIVVALACTVNLYADDFSEHFVAAKAGVVNYLEGSPQVSFGNEGKVATPRGQVKTGDSIKTGAQDRLEILLNPGSYLRLGFNSELRVVDTAFDAMHFELVRGSVIVESATFNRKVHALRIGTPAGDVIFDKNGLYRLEAQPSAVYLAVHEGRAQWLKEGAPIAGATAAAYHGGVAEQYALTDSTTMGLGLMYGGL
jgi:ferric-dicitrate binding protein FerR (iron transport regulator)